MKATQIIPVIKAALQNNINLCISGAPGTGKSSIVEQVTKELNYDLITEIGSVSDPTDYKGAIYVNNGEANFLPFNNLRRLLNPTIETVMFIDDLLWASPAVISAISSLILLREVNGQKISDKVRFIAATNRKLDNCNVNNAPLSLVSRFGSIVNLDVDLESWKKWALNPNNNIPLEVVSFLNFRPNLISNFTGKKDLENFACPRTWEACSKWIRLGISDFETISGAIGQAAATEFLAFYKTYKELAGLPEKVILNPLNTEIPTNQATLYALFGALSHKATEKNYDAILSYVERCPTEFAVFYIKDSTTRNPKLTQTEAFVKFCAKHQDLIV